MRCVLDMRLQLVLEPHADYGKLISEAVLGGVTCIQYRDKTLSDRDFYHQALEIQAICRRNKVPLIINDRVHIALALEVQGLHLGQTDMPFEIARRLLPDFMSIGLSVESLEEVKEANRLEVDYLAISPVFSTSSKQDVAEPFGVNGFLKARELSRHALIAIGGINSTNVRCLKESGADGIAVISAICRSKNPREAAQALLL